jgi:sugar lactone lactonase YvrE
LNLTAEGTLVLGFKDDTQGLVAQEFGIGEKGLEPRRELVRSLKEIETRSLGGFTQLKLFQGKLYYGAYGKLMRLTPGAAEAEVALDPKFAAHLAMFEAFAFTPDGDLYLASHWQGKSRGVNVYRCRKTADGAWDKPVSLNDGKPLAEAWHMIPTDLAADAQGRLLLRLDNPDIKSSGPTTTLFRYSPADGKRELLLHLGPTRPWGDYGLHVAADGKTYIAGGGTAGIWCLAADGKVLWQTRFETHQGEESTALRQPLGITTDSKGRVWVTEPARNHVLCLTPDGKVLNTYGRFGTIDDRDGLSLCQPVGIAAVKDAAGSEWIYIADVNNQRLVKWRLVE